MTGNKSNDDLVTKQQNDPSLASCWEMAKVNKGNFVIDREMLFHVDKVEGVIVTQLCVPKCRRYEMLQLAHDSPSRTKNTRGNSFIILLAKVEAECKTGCGHMSVLSVTLSTENVRSCAHDGYH